MNIHLFNDTSLHIAVVTTKCNLSCSYCQTKTPSPQDMTAEVALRILTYLYDVKNPKVTLEFQGGEPLLNWPVVRMMIETARKSNTVGKELKIALVSNLMLLDDEKMKVLAKNNVQVCSSLDGPQDIHDANRRDLGGDGTYRKVIAKVRQFEQKYGQKINFLPTITKRSLSRGTDIVDEYVRRQQSEICLRPVNNMGSACCAWGDLGYEPEDFCKFYARAMDHILSLNQQGVNITERTARVILTKVLTGLDPGFVDMMNPCGAGRATMAYMPDGSCYPCDEARMLNEDMFRLGNILEEKYEDMIKKDNLLQLLHSSCSDLWHYTSAFSPWMGFCPVVNYALQRNVVPRVACSPAQKIQEFQFRYVFDKILEGGITLDIFKSWVTRGTI
jgi:His-Xaa-Ser system radical SAM maturase HxsB